jgi:hypothetical protein
MVKSRGSKSHQRNECELSKDRRVEKKGNTQQTPSLTPRQERQEARGKRQEARGKRQEARGKRQEARGKRQEARGDGTNLIARCPAWICERRSGGHIPRTHLLPLQLHRRTQCICTRPRCILREVPVLRTANKTQVEFRIQTQAQAQA